MSDRMRSERSTALPTGDTGSALSPASLKSQSLQTPLTDHSTAAQPLAFEKMLGLNKTSTMTETNMGMNMEKSLDNTRLPAKSAAEQNISKGNSLKSDITDPSKFTKELFRSTNIPNAPAQPMNYQLKNHILFRPEDIISKKPLLKHKIPIEKHGMQFTPRDVLHPPTLKHVETIEKHAPLETPSGSFQKEISTKKMTGLSQSQVEEENWEQEGPQSWTGQVKEKLSSKLSPVLSSVQSKLAPATENFKVQYNQMKGKMSDVTSNMSNQFSHVKDSMSTQLSSAKQSVGNRLSSAKETASNATSDMSEQLGSVSEQISANAPIMKERTKNMMTAGWEWSTYNVQRLSRHPTVKAHLQSFVELVNNLARLQPPLNFLLFTLFISHIVMPIIFFNAWEAKVVLFTSLCRLAFAHSLHRMTGFSSVLSLSTLLGAPMLLYLWTRAGLGHPYAVELASAIDHSGLKHVDWLPLEYSSRWYVFLLWTRFILMSESAALPLITMHNLQNWNEHIGAIRNGLGWQSSSEYESGEESGGKGSQSEWSMEGENLSQRRSTDKNRQTNINIKKEQKQWVPKSSQQQWHAKSSRGGINEPGERGRESDYQQNTESELPFETTENPIGMPIPSDSQQTSHSCSDHSRYCDMNTEETLRAKREYPVEDFADQRASSNKLSGSGRYKRSSAQPTVG